MASAFSLALGSIAAAGSNTPVANRGPEKLRSPNPVIARINRAGVTGSVSLMGANVGQIGTSKPGSQVATRITLPGSGAYSITTDLAYAAFSDNNLIVVVNGTVLAYNASPAAATDFSIADSGGYAVITIGTAGARPADKAALEIYKVTPAELIAAGTQVVGTKSVEIVAKDFLWLKASGGTVDATQGFLESRA